MEYSKAALIQKAKEKSLYKYRGKVLDVIRVSENIVNLIMFKLSKKEKVLICFSCYGEVGEYFRNHAAKNDRFKIKFKIKSQQYNGKYFNNLVVSEYEIWRLNDDKLAKAERTEKIEKSMAEKAKAKQTGIKFNESDW